MEFFMGKGNLIVFDEKEKIKVEKLLESVKLLPLENLNEIYKSFSAKFSSSERKKIFITLMLHYFSADFVKWNLIKDKIDLLNKKDSSKKGIFSFLKKEKTEEKKDSDEKKFTELYINIGKDKRIFPKDLIHFICSSMRIDANDINNIRIYEKYSFFQIPADLCEKAIVLLSVKSLRGKNIKVNYARNDGNGV
jgi:hypothetical protein